MSSQSLFTLPALLLLLATLGGVRCQFRSISGGFKLKHVSTSVNYLWGVTMDDKIYRCNRPCNGAWVRVPGDLKQLDIGDEEVWGVNKNNDIFKRPVDGSGGWAHIRGKLKHVSASGNGYIWGVNAGDHIYRCKKPCRGAWIGVGGRLKQVDGGHGYVYGVNSANQVFALPVDGSGGWRHIPGIRLKHITASGRNEVFGTSNDNRLYRCQKPCVGDWELMEEKGMQQCDATFDSVVGIDHYNYVFEQRTGI